MKSPDKKLKSLAALKLPNSRLLWNAVAQVIDHLTNWSQSTTSRTFQMRFLLKSSYTSLSSKWRTRGLSIQLMIMSHLRSRSVVWIGTLWSIITKWWTSKKRKKSTCTRASHSVIRGWTKQKRSCVLRSWAISMSLSRSIVKLRVSLQATMAVSIAQRCQPLLSPNSSSELRLFSEWKSHLKK